MLRRMRSEIAQGLLRMFPRVVPPAFTLPIYFERRRTPRNRIARLLYSAVAFNYDLVVVERVVEIPFVLQNLPPVAHARILDFGCTESPLPIHLASLGHRVTGVDLRPYPYAHPGFKFVHGDFIQAGLPSGEFDAVVAVSAIEHCGLGQYGASASTARRRAFTTTRRSSARSTACSSRVGDCSSPFRSASPGRRRGIASTTRRASTGCWPRSP